MLIGATLSVLQGTYLHQYRAKVHLERTDAIYRHMQHKAGNLGVDLLLIDTGMPFESPLLP